jgi:hypothetical protein
MGGRSDARYFGKVCGKHPGLAGERRQSDNDCPACSRERSARWRKANRAKALDATARWEKAHPEKTRARVTRWLKANPGKAAEYAVRWQKANPAKVQATAGRRRARKRNAVVPLTAEEKARIEALYAEARRLTRETGEQHNVDHDRPLARGGKHHPDNLNVVPAVFDRKKGARYDSMWDFITS